MRLFAVFLLAAGLSGAATPKLSFSKSFPGSVPAYESIEIEPTGDFTYKEAIDDAQPLKAKMKDVDAAALFGMAEKLGFFKSPIESGLKVANTGKKIFRYVDANGTPTETTFNYSTDITAQQLLERFEQIGASERAYIDLDRTIHFDKLGINDSLAQIESLWLRKQLAAPDQFFPLLTRIASHESFMHLVRERAARLKDEFQAGGPPTPMAAGNEQKEK